MKYALKANCFGHHKDKNKINEVNASGMEVEIFPENLKGFKNLSGLAKAYITPKNKKTGQKAGFLSVSRKIIFSFLLPEQRLWQLLQLPEQLSSQHVKFSLGQLPCCLGARVCNCLKPVW